MNKKTAKAIKEDFRNWSGDFQPESDDQITVYVDYALPQNVDKEEVRNLLRDWMEVDEPFDPRKD